MPYWLKGIEKEAWPSFGIEAAGPWNYSLILKSDRPEENFEVIQKNWPADNFPFMPEATPIVLKARGKKIPAWQSDQCGLAGELQDNPVRSTAPEEIIELISMGAARWRVSAFPVIGDGPDAGEWQ